MPWQPRASGALLKCGTCGKRYTNPLTHVCVQTRARRRTSTAVKPKVSVSLVTCGTCGKRYNNPLTHTCKVKTDFKRRAKAAAKATAKATAKGKTRRAPPQHDYANCDEASCERFPCRVYAEGRQRGYREGYDEGEAAGFAEGKSEGFDEGFGQGYSEGAESAGE